MRSLAVDIDYQPVPRRRQLEGRRATRAGTSGRGKLCVHPPARPVRRLSSLASAGAQAGANRRPEAEPDPGTGGSAQISTWVISSVNGGVARPAGVSSCTPWALFDGSTFGGPTVNPVTVNPATGLPATIYFRTCDTIVQFVYVGPQDPGDLSRAAYQKVIHCCRVPRSPSRRRSTRWWSTSRRGSG